jgi:hypothetical protein
MAMTRKAQRERLAIIGVEAAMLWPHGDVPNEATPNRADALRKWRGQDEGASSDDDCDPKRQIVSRK